MLCFCFLLFWWLFSYWCVLASRILYELTLEDETSCYFQLFFAVAKAPSGLILAFCLAFYFDKDDIGSIELKSYKNKVSQLHIGCHSEV